MKISYMFLAILIILSQGCTYAVRYDGTYRGKVIDAETGQPMEETVVLGTWYTITPTVAGSVSKYYDARETVTDRNGEFLISGMGLRIMSNLEPMHFLIFKPGYEYIGPMSWVSLKVDILFSKKIKWEENKPIIQLKKLTTEERKKSGTFPPYPPIEIPKEKTILMMEYIYKERKERGLD